MKRKLSPIQAGEMTASHVVNFFDNVCDDNGNKLTQSAKRTRIKELMMQLYYLHPEENICVLPNQERVAIIVCRQNEGRAAFCYFNNVDAPQDAILQAFAEKEGITYKNRILEPKREGELIANDAKQFLDNVSDKNGKKLTGTPKLERLHQLFSELYLNKAKNICYTPAGKIPVIVARKGENSREVYCLNTSEHRQEVLKAFATKTGCSYLEYKENLETPSERQPGEMTARECARIFHNVSDLGNQNSGRYASPKLVKWFEYIGTNKSLNQVRLPRGNVVPLVVYRQSHSQKCWCLNSADERVKPFVIKRMAEITKADVCIDNITFSPHKSQQLYQGILNLYKEMMKTEDYKSRSYYSEYASKIYRDMHLGKEINFQNWLKNQKTGKE